MKLLEYINRYPQEFGLYNCFLTLTWKTQATKRKKSVSWTSLKWRSFVLQKTLSESEMTTLRIKEVIANHISYKDLASTILKKKKLYDSIIKRQIAH